MFDDNYDPYDTLTRLDVMTQSLEYETREVKNTQERQAHLMEMMAHQIKHLTNAIIGLQTQNKLLTERLDHYLGTVNE